MGTSAERQQEAHRVVSGAGRGRVLYEGRVCEEALTKDKIWSCYLGVGGASRQPDRDWGQVQAQTAREATDH